MSTSPKRGTTTNGRGGKRLTQRDMDSSCHRLSRVPQKFSTSKAIQAEKSEPYAVSYFKNNPEAAQDIRPPDEKLQEIEQSLQDPNLDASTKFALLIQQKALRFISYGETSPEAVYSYSAIGTFYNENHRPESAIRHLNKAKSLIDESGVEVEEEDQVQIAVELATAHLTYKTTKHTNEAYNALNPYIETKIEDQYYVHMRALDMAKILNFKGEHEEADDYYNQACSTYEQAHEYEQNNQDYAQKSNELWAKLYVEAADNAEEAEKISAAKDYYKEAANKFEAAGKEDMANSLQEKIKELEEEEEREKALRQEEEEEQREQNDNEDLEAKERNMPPPEENNEAQQESQHSSSSSKHSSANSSKHSSAKQSPQGSAHDSPRQSPHSEHNEEHQEDETPQQLPEEEKPQTLSEHIMENADNILEHTE